MFISAPSLDYTRDYCIPTVYILSNSRYSTSTGYTEYTGYSYTWGGGGVLGDGVGIWRLEQEVRDGSQRRKLEMEVREGSQSGKLEWERDEVGSGKGMVQEVEKILEKVW